MSNSDDPITAYSRMVGGSGLDSPRVFSEIPDPPPGFDPEQTPMFVNDEPQPNRATPLQITFDPYAQVFLVDEQGNAEYQALLRKGANGEVILGRKEITDMRGTTAYKVYQEWMVPIKAKKKAGKGSK